MVSRLVARAQLCVSRGCVGPARRRRDMCCWVTSPRSRPWPLRPAFMLHLLHGFGDASRPRTSVRCRPADSRSALGVSNISPRPQLPLPASYGRVTAPPLDDPLAVLRQLSWKRLLAVSSPQTPLLADPSRAIGATTSTPPLSDTPASSPSNLRSSTPSTPTDTRHAARAHRTPAVRCRRERAGASSTTSTIPTSARIPPPCCAERLRASSRTTAPLHVTPRVPPPAISPGRP